MRKSVKRLYELDRSYDYADAYGFKNTKRNVGFVKRRSHKRLRQQLKKHGRLIRTDPELPSDNVNGSIF